MIEILSDNTIRIQEIRGNTIEPISVDFEEDITGWDFELQLKKSKKHSTAAMTLAIGTGLSISGTSVIIAPTATQMDINGDTYYFDLKATDLSDNVDSSRFRGVWIIEDNVTR